MATISDERLAELLEFAEYKEAELISDGLHVAAENWNDLFSVLTEVKSLRSQAGVRKVGIRTQGGVVINADLPDGSILYVLEPGSAASQGETK